MSEHARVRERPGARRRRGAVPPPGRPRPGRDGGRRRHRSDRARQRPGRGAVRLRPRASCSGSRSRCSCPMPSDGCTLGTVPATSPIPHRDRWASGSSSLRGDATARSSPPRSAWPRSTPHRGRIVSASIRDMTERLAAEREREQLALEAELERTETPGAPVAAAGEPRPARRRRGARLQQPARRHQQLRRVRARADRRRADAQRRRPVARRPQRTSATSSRRPRVRRASPGSCSRSPGATWCTRVRST